jgi:hypothetical protein
MAAGQHVCSAQWATLVLFRFECGRLWRWLRAPYRVRAGRRSHQLRALYASAASGLAQSVSFWVRECYCQSRDSAVMCMQLGSARDAGMLTGVWRACESQAVPHTSNMVVLIVVLDGCRSARLEALEAIGC